MSIKSAYDKGYAAGVAAATDEYQRKHGNVLALGQQLAHRYRLGGAPPKAPESPKVDPGQQHINQAMRGPGTPQSPKQWANARDNNFAGMGFGQ